MEAESTPLQWLSNDYIPAAFRPSLERGVVLTLFAVAHLLWLVVLPLELAVYR